MLDHVVYRIYLQQLEYKMEPVDLPDDYNFSKLDIVVTLLSFMHIINKINPLN